MYKTDAFRLLLSLPPPHSLSGNSLFGLRAADGHVQVFSSRSILVMAREGHDPLKALPLELVAQIAQNLSVFDLLDAQKVIYRISSPLAP